MKKENPNLTPNPYSQDLNSIYHKTTIREIKDHAHLIHELSEEASQYIELLSNPAPASSYERERFEEDLEELIKVLWHIVGEEDPILTQEDKSVHCGDPYYMGMEGSRVIYGYHLCVDRNCSRCVDHGYVPKSARNTLSQFQSIIHALIREGQYRVKYRGKNCTLKLYSFIVDTGPHTFINSQEELIKDRNKAIKILKRAGILGGFLIVHPYRGGVSRDGPHKRAELDRSKQSVHYHGIGWGYWTDNSKELGLVEEFLEIKKIGVLNKHIGNNENIWAKFYDLLYYEYNHAGFIKDNSQVCVRFGKKVKTIEEDVPPEVKHLLKDPETEEIFKLEGVPLGILEKLQSPKHFIPNRLENPGKPPPINGTYIGYLDTQLYCIDYYEIVEDRTLLIKWNYGLIDFIKSS